MRKCAPYQTCAGNQQEHAESAETARISPLPPRPSVPVRADCRDTVDDGGGLVAHS